MSDYDTTTKRKVSGLVTVVQEERFLLHDDTGSYVQLRLSHKANVDPVQLRRFQETNRHVTVEYSGTSNINTAVASSIKPS